jgi:hypothetical protein
MAFVADLDNHRFRSTGESGLCNQRCLQSSPPVRTSTSADNFCNLWSRKPESDRSFHQPLDFQDFATPYEI